MNKVNPKQKVSEEAKIQSLQQPRFYQSHWRGMSLLTCDTIEAHGFVDIPNVHLKQTKFALILIKMKIKIN